jgi:hypothetical protein
LELRVPDADTNADYIDARHWLPDTTEYQDLLKVFRLGLAFSDSDGELNRLALQYQLGSGITKNWP